MQPFFSKAGIAALREFCRRRPLLALDYDGTLTGLVNDPRDSLLSDAMQRLLGRLRNYAQIAVISGRHLPELKTLLGDVEIDFLIGNHGLDHGDASHPELLRAQDWVAQWLTQLQAQPLEDAKDGMARYWNAGVINVPGVWIEDKRYTLTLHYRSAANPDQAMAAIGAALSRLHPAPHIGGGKMVFNLFPSTEVNKGSALLRLMAEQGFDNAIFFGDDDTDEDVFRLEHPNILGIRVGPHPESLAHYYLLRQRDMSKALAYSLVCLQRQATEERSGR